MLYFGIGAEISISLLVIFGELPAAAAWVIIRPVCTRIGGGILRLTGFHGLPSGSSWFSQFCSVRILTYSAELRSTLPRGGSAARRHMSSIICMASGMLRAFKTCLMSCLPLPHLKRLDANENVKILEDGLANCFHDPTNAISV